MTRRLHQHADGAVADAGRSIPAPITSAPGQAITRKVMARCDVSNINDDGERHDGRRVEVGEGIEETFGLD
jgi:hypothetical protein